MAEPELKSVEMIKRLCGFDTTSRDSNLALIEWVRGYLSDLGIESELTYDDDRRKANLYATLGPKDRPGICLSGHTDVVPVDGQDWDTDPFEVTEKDGRLYGRGTCDMKSWLAVALAYTPEFLRRELEIPIHLALSYDEEIGCVGVRRLIAGFDHMPIKPTLCIVGEPTNMKLVIAHKGKKSFRCRVRGLECHSSLTPYGVNAVEAAAELVSHLKGMAKRIAAEGPFDDGFDVPYTSVHTGVIHGGTALNIVPRDCYFDFEFRHLPDDDPEALHAEITAYGEQNLLPDMHAVSKDTGITWEPLSEFPGLDSSEDDPAVELVRSLTGENTSSKAAFGTEAGLFQQAGVSTVVCGPGHIDQAHKPNEFVALEQISICEAMMRNLIDRVCRS